MVTGTRIDASSIQFTWKKITTVCVCVCVQVHGRSREQRYTKQADWDYIGTCAEAAAPMPLFGCGDMLSYEDYNIHRQQATGIMIARYIHVHVHVCAVLLCLVCLFDLPCFFFSSFSSLI